MPAVAAILMSLLFLVVQCRAAEFTPTTASGETLRNIFRAGEQAVVGSSAALYRIDLNSLSVQETLALPSENRMLVPDLEETNFVSCDSNRCFLAAISDFNQVSWEVPSGTIIKRETDDTVASILAPSMTGVPELTFGEVANIGNGARRFVKGALSSTTPEFISIADYQGANRFESFNYHLEFAHNGFIYFVTDRDDESIYPRVTRFCQNDTGADGRFGSQYEIRLGCGSEEASNDRRITTATFVTGPPFNEPTILIATLTNGASTVDICSYSVAEIDRRMWDHFVDCIDGVLDVMSGFRRDGQSQCVAVLDFQRAMALQSICRLPGLRLGLEVPEIYWNDSLVTQEFTNNEHFTSLTTTTVQSSLLLFAGSSKSKLHQFRFISSSSATFVRSICLNEILTSTSKNVTHLFPSAIGEFVYAMTPNRVIKVPVVEKLFPNASNIPTLEFVEPNVGFVRGGMDIVIRGTALDSGDMVSVFLDGPSGPPCILGGPCSRSSTEIMCTTSAVSSPSTSPGVVVVRVDGQVFMNSSVTFTYHSDPVFTRLQPTFTIPAGGVHLTYSGSNLDIDGSIEIRIEDSIPFPCEVVTSTALYCLAPPLQATNTALNYKLILDGTPFLDSKRESVDLQLTLRPDPTNFTLLTTSVIMDPSSPATLRIGGNNFGSVLPKEFAIIVGGQPCNITSTDISIAAIGKDKVDCTPPLSPDLNGQWRATVIVMVGQNINNIFAGDSGLLYINPSSSASIIPAAIIVPVVVVVLCGLVLLAVLIAWLRRKAKLRAREHKQLNWQIQSLAMKGPISASRMNTLVEEFVQNFPAKLIIPSSQIRMLDIPLGQGQFGVVYKAQLVKQNSLNDIFSETVAVKLLKDDLQNTLSEVSKMSELSHPNIMNLVGVCTGLSQGPGIVMPYMANGSLLDYLKKERKDLYLEFDADDETVHSVRKLLLRMCYQISLGMTYLALQKVVHRDLATRNCMLDAKGDIKVSDFGLSEDVYTAGYFRQNKDNKVKLPFKWMALESLMDGIFNEKTDVWSFGVTCWEVFSGGRIPYPGVDPVDLPKLLQEGMRLNTPSNIAITPEILSLMVECWKASPDDRPTFEVLSTTFGSLLHSAAGYMEINMVLETEGTTETDYEIMTTPCDPEDGMEMSSTTAGIEMVQNSAYATKTSA